MSDYCPNCGCRLRGGICPNCYEELVIMGQIWEDGTPMTVSDEFAQKVREQQTETRRNKGGDV